MSAPAITYQIDNDGVAWVTFDDPEAKVNVFTPAVMAELEATLDELRPKPLRGVVFISAKPGVFIAGADLHELAKVEDATRARELSRAGHRVFAKIGKLSSPTVAAIDGACLGGGYEFALACQWRVATDSPKTSIGLPETQLGIVPGWGGTQRLPRLIGLRQALSMIVAGHRVDAARALRLGMIDAVVPPIALRETATAIAKGEQKPRRRSVGMENRWPARGLICNIARKRAAAKTGGHYPAPLEAIDVIEDGLKAGSLDEALELEALTLGELAATPICKSLIRVFFLREQQQRLDGGGRAGGRLEKIGVLGAGLMGAGIAQWCSARGLRVRLKDLKPEFVAGGIKRIAAVYADGVKRRKLTRHQAEQGRARISPTTDYTGFGDCDLVIEAVLEKLDIKQQLYEELTPVLSEDCVIASNTSAIRIDDLARASGRPTKFVGLHFFNPVHRMPLVEIVRGTKTSEKTVAIALALAKQLKKIPLVVKGTPGFLVNRLLMPYLNEAGLLVGEGVSVEAIDTAMVAFGWPMGPLRLVDEVGIGVAYEVARELADAFIDRMQVAPVLRELHEAGCQGRKGGLGFYRYDGKKETVNPRFRTSRELTADEIQRRLMAVMAAEAERCLAEEVVASEDQVDVGLIFGAGFPPFRGGLIRYAREAGLWKASGHPELPLQAE